MTLASLDDDGAIGDAVRRLETARSRYVGAGFPVQGLRIATQPLGGLCRRSGLDAALAAIRRLDRQLDAVDIDLSLGPLLTRDRPDQEFAAWAADLAAATRRTFWSVSIASPRSGIHEATVEVAAATIARLARVHPGGETNFRFAAGACIRPSTPFFPVAFHRGPAGFALALESASLVSEAFGSARSPAAAAEALAALLDERLQPIERLSTELARELAIRFAGIDLSPAPSLENSIVTPIETLSGGPFGAPATLAACAAVTRGLDRSRVRGCGYSGLMLPVPEDRRLAQRATESRFGVRDLLLYSSVCGTGLDLVPLPGATPESELRGLLLDVASLALRWRKPLAARLLPIPGREAGDPVDFENPHLTAAAVLSPG